MTFASHRERQFMQYLRGEGWIQARLLPASARLVENLEGAGGQEGTRPGRSAPIPHSPRGNVP
jgi:hypothetical protein